MLQNINSFGILASHWLRCDVELEMYLVQASEEKKTAEINYKIIMATLGAWFCIRVTIDPF